MTRNRDLDRFEWVIFGCFMALILGMGLAGWLHP